MTYLSRWKVLLILGVVLWGVLNSLPNAVTMPSFLPQKTVNLGLDLQGGSHLLLQVDIDSAISDRAESFVQTARGDLRQAKIGYTRIAAIPGGLRVSLNGGQDRNDVRSTLRKLDPDLEITFSPDGRSVDAILTETALERIRSQTIDQSIEIVRRRIDETGTREPVIARQGADRIIVQLPGVDDPERIKDILGKTAQLAFHLVDTGSGKVNETTRNLPMTNDPGQTLTVARRPMITGDMLTNAQPTMQNGQPIVSFSLNTLGARRFCDVTREFQGEPFAIVLDGSIISAPRINEAICGGSAVITGQFTVQETNDLSLLLRAGALPAPLHVAEERTVGPSLGADSVAAGKKALAMALLFVAIMAITVYGLFGIFSTVALLVNVTMIIAILSALQATLTLPGIAGIVLAIGLAVDGNVLVYERIKEELRAGKSVLASIDAGYTRAHMTIVDSNLTSLISALILFSFGTGPIKGFAVTMCIGVVTSYFCAMLLTRLMVMTWYARFKPKTINA